MTDIVLTRAITRYLAEASEKGELPLVITTGYQERLGTRDPDNMQQVEEADFWEEVPSDRTVSPRRVIALLASAVESDLLTGRVFTDTQSDGRVAFQKVIIFGVTLQGLKFNGKEARP